MSDPSRRMDIPALQGFVLEHGLMTLEQPLRTREQQRSMRIGVPKETSNEERRVALTPSGVGVLVADGHEVFIEAGAGAAAHFEDNGYSEAGAQIVSSPADVYSKAELLVKVGPPCGDEMDLLQEKQTVISALHLGNTSADFLQHLMDLRITGIGFEFIRDKDGTLPIVRMMHEIMGSMAVQISARYLESGEGGKGVMLGGISGVPPSTVAILGAGVVGEWAARTALGFGAHVIVLDTDLSALRGLEHYLDRRITTAMAPSVSPACGPLSRRRDRSNDGGRTAIAGARDRGDGPSDAPGFGHRGRRDGPGGMHRDESAHHAFGAHLHGARRDSLLRAEHALERRADGHVCAHERARAVSHSHR
jgi:hypothetical protein